MNPHQPAKVIFAIMLLTQIVRADVLTLKNGSTVEGTVIKFGDQYRVKTADGQTRSIAVADVVSRSMSAPTTAGVSIQVSSNFQSTKSRADAVDAPIQAVTIWEKYIESNAMSPDLSAAKMELDKWQKLSADDAERVGGKWIGGDERRKLLSDVNRLCTEARAQLENQTVQAIEKYEQALRIYPNCFEANFALGYFYLRRGAGGATGRINIADVDRAIKSLETSVKLQPNSAAALSNLAVGYNLRERFEEAVLTAYRAVRIRDDKEVVENLLGCIKRAPVGMRNNNRNIKPIIEQSGVLAAKYKIDPNAVKGFHYIVPDVPDPNTPGPRAGIIGNGSGFLVSADGYIVTNRHVVEGKNRLFRVRFDDSSEKNAEVVAIDTVNDVALIKIKSDKPLPYLKIASADLPNPGARCMVLGYPVANMLGFKMQVTTGEVSSTNTKDEYQVMLTATTTHGNSGGPIVDRDGNVIGVLSAGASAFNVTYLKALSAGQVRSFFDRIKEKFSGNLETGKATDVTFDGEKLAQQARKATVLVLIIRGDGKDAPGDN